MKNKKNNRKLMIILVLLSLTSCIGGGFARLLSNYIISDPWIECVVGLGIAGTYFFAGVLGVVSRKMAPGITRKIFVTLIGVVGIILGLIFLYIALRQIANAIGL